MSGTTNPEQLFIRLYLDHHIKRQLAEDLRAQGYDVLTTEEAGMSEAGDEEQLIFASDRNRAILTFNIRDFAPLHQQWIADERTHAGIIVSQQLGSRQYGILLRRTLRLLDQMSAEEMRNTLVHLEQFRE